jgi:Tol biopolymer transport system component
MGNLILLGAVGVVILLGVVLAVTLFSGLSGNEQILIGDLGASGRADLYLLELGETWDEDAVVAENAQISNEAWFYIFKNRQFANWMGGEYGGFVPNSNRILCWYQDRNEQVIIQELDGKGKPYELFSTDALPLVGILYGEKGPLFLQETRGNQERCYVSEDGDTARLLKGDLCWSDNSGQVVFSRDDDGNKVTLTAIDMDGQDERTLMDDLENVGTIVTSDDGSHVAYQQELDGSYKLYIVETRDSKIREVDGEFYALLDYDFIPSSDVVYYVGENDDGLLELRTSNTSEALATGSTLGVVPSDDGKYLLSVVGNGETETAYVHPLQGGEKRELLTSLRLEYGITATLDRFWIRSTTGTDSVLYSLKYDGSDLVELFEGDEYLYNIQYVPEGKQVYFQVRESGGNNLVATGFEEGSDIQLLDEWYALELLNLSDDGSMLAFWGQEGPGDDVTLYSILIQEGAKPVELDDDGYGIPNAVFSRDGRRIIYTLEEGSGWRDMDVMQVPVDGSERPEVVHEGAFLADVKWTSIAPFHHLSLSSTREGTSYCPRATSIALSERVEGELVNNQPNCYRAVLNEGEFVTFEGNTSESEDLDIALTLYDRTGTWIDHNDDGPKGKDPQLDVVPTASGVYFIEVSKSGYGDGSNYSLAMREGYLDEAFRNAEMLREGESTRGVVNADSDIYIPMYDWEGFGHVYYFWGESGDEVVINVYAESIGSALDPVLILFDATQDYLDEDDDGGDGLDSRLRYSLESAGRYYVMVTSADGTSGDENDYFYDVVLSIE